MIGQVTDPRPITTVHADECVRLITADGTGIAGVVTAVDGVAIRLAVNGRKSGDYWMTDRPHDCVISWPHVAILTVVREEGTVE